MCVLTNKRHPEVWFYRFNTKSRKFERKSYGNPDVMLPQQPSHMVFNHDTLNLAFRKFYRFMEFYDSKPEKGYPSTVNISHRPYIYCIHSNLYINVSEPNLGVFVDGQGNLQQHTPIQFHSDPIIDMAIAKDFLIVLFRSLIQVFNIKSSNLLQTVKMNEHKSVSKNGPYTFLA